MSLLGQKRRSRIVADKSASPVTADLSEPPTDFALGPTGDVQGNSIRSLYARVPCGRNNEQARLAITSP